MSRFALFWIGLLSVGCSSPKCADALDCEGSVVLDAGTDTGPSGPACIAKPSTVRPCAAGRICRGSDARCEVPSDAGTADAAVPTVSACGPISCEAPCGCVDPAKGVCDCTFEI